MKIMKIPIRTKRKKQTKVTPQEAKRSQRESRDLKYVLMDQLKKRGCPEPETEVMAVPGRRWKFDLCWTHWDNSDYIGDQMDLSNRGLLVEVQGVGRHQQVWRKDGYQNDCEKLNAAQLEGYTVLWFTSKQVKNGEAADFLERIL